MRKVLSLKQKCSVCKEFYAKYVVFDIKPQLLAQDKVTYAFVCEDCLKGVAK